MGKLRIRAVIDGVTVDYWHNGRYIGYSWCFLGRLYKSQGLKGFIKEHGL